MVPILSYDCVIVGGGAAGLSAALVLGRARQRTLLLDAGGQSNRVVEHVGGGLMLDGTAPGELYAAGRARVSQYGSVEVRDMAVGELRPGFEAELEDGTVVASRAVIVASGMDYEVPEVFREHWGRGALHCPFCDGWEVRDQRVVVAAEGEKGDHLERMLPAWTSTLQRVSDVRACERAGDGLRLTLAGGEAVEADAVFIAPVMRPRTAFLEGLSAERTEMGALAVDAQQRTSVPFLYAAGDVSGVPPQVAIAAGSGHLAGTVAVRELLLTPGGASPLEPA